MPYFGSGDCTECPPRIGMPASFAFDAPPARISRRSSTGSSFGKGHQVEREQRLRPHRPDVAHRVGRGDLPVGERVVEHRGEEVHRLHHRQVLGEPVHRRVVAGLEADQRVLRLRCSAAPPAARRAGRAAASPRNPRRPTSSTSADGASAPLTPSHPARTYSRCSSSSSTVDTAQVVLLGVVEHALQRAPVEHQLEHVELRRASGRAAARSSAPPASASRRSPAAPAECAGSRRAGAARPSAAPRSRCRARP